MVRETPLMTADAIDGQQLANYCNQVSCGKLIWTPEVESDKPIKADDVR